MLFSIIYLSYLAIAPVWKDYEVEFNYSTLFPKKLEMKTFKLDLYNKRSIGRDRFIGGVEIDLYTIATGPVHHELSLKDVSEMRWIFINRALLPLEKFISICILNNYQKSKQN